MDNYEVCLFIYKIALLSKLIERPVTSITTTEFPYQPVISIATIDFLYQLSTTVDCPKQQLISKLTTDFP